MYRISFLTRFFIVGRTRGTRARVDPPSTIERKEVAKCDAAAPCNPSAGPRQHGSNHHKFRWLPLAQKRLAQNICTRRRLQLVDWPVNPHSVFEGNSRQRSVPVKRYLASRKGPAKKLKSGERPVEGWCKAGQTSRSRLGLCPYKRRRSPRMPLHMPHVFPKCAPTRRCNWKAPQSHGGIATKAQVHTACASTRLNTPRHPMRAGAAPRTAVRACGAA